jgi:hypothetical protein
VAAETIRDWIKDYRQNGFDGLLPKVRGDVGQARTIPREVADLLCTIKDDKRALSVRMVINEARATGEVPAELELAPATVQRFFVFGDTNCERWGAKRGMGHLWPSFIPPRRSRPPPFQYAVRGRVTMEARCCACRYSRDRGCG